MTKRMVELADLFAGGGIANESFADLEAQMPKCLKRHQEILDEAQRLRDAGDEEGFRRKMDEASAYIRKACRYDLWEKAAAEAEQWEKERAEWNRMRRRLKKQ